MNLKKKEVIMIFNIKWIKKLKDSKMLVISLIFILNYNKLMTKIHWIKILKKNKRWTRSLVLTKLKYLNLISTSFKSDN